MTFRRADWGEGPVRIPHPVFRNEGGDPQKGRQRLHGTGRGMRRPAYRQRVPAQSQEVPLWRRGQAVAGLGRQSGPPLSGKRPHLGVHTANAHPYAERSGCKYALGWGVPPFAQTKAGIAGGGGGPGTHEARWVRSAPRWASLSKAAGTARLQNGADARGNAWRGLVGSRERGPGLCGPRPRGQASPGVPTICSQL